MLFRSIAMMFVGLLVPALLGAGILLVCGPSDFIQTWDMNGGDFAQVINLNTGLPLEANGQYSFSEGDVIFELTSGMQYELEVLPMAIGTPYKSISQKVKVWPL